MLEEISWEQLREWQEFTSLDPFPEERTRAGFASVCQALWNIARDTVAQPDGYPLSKFFVFMGDDPLPIPVAPEPIQTVEYQEHLIDSWVFFNNAVIEAQEKGIR